MSGRDDSPEWQRLAAEDLRWLDRWLDAADLTLEFRRWFDDGRSNQPVGLVVVHDDVTGLRRMVLKICDTEAQALSLKQVWTRSESDFRARHLLERHEAIPLRSSWAVLSRVATGGFDGHVALSKRARDTDFPDLCARIVSSVVEEWNRGTIGRQGTAGPVREFLLDRLNRRLTGVHRWAQASGIETDGGTGTVQRLGWAEPLTNPFVLLAQAPADQILQDVGVGRAHGDLNGRNILVPPYDRDLPGEYTLIDADRFRPDAALAWDPMHLLVALVLDRFDELSPQERQDLIIDIVEPSRTKPLKSASNLRAVSTAIWQASGQLARGGDFSEVWTMHCLLSLVGVGLIHTGRILHTADPESAQAWCFDLAAKAAQAYLRMDEQHKQIRSRPKTKLLISSPAGGALVEDAAVEMPVPDAMGMLDNVQERGRLRSALVDVGRGVVVVQGPEGVGKSMLVRSGLANLRVDRLIEPGLRVCKHEVPPGSRFDVKTLIDDVAGGTEPAAAIRFGESSLSRLTAMLEAVGDRRVVVIVDRAENLLHEKTGELIDLDLDEALEAIATLTGHRVCVVLITRNFPASSIGASWSTSGTPIVLSRLPYTYFRSFLARLDRGRPGFSTLDEFTREQLYRRLEGNPRRTELLHAVLELTDSAGPAALVRQLSEMSPAAVVQKLPTMLVDGLSPLRRDVLAALGAYGLPVLPEMVVALVGAEHGADKIRHALDAVTLDHLARRTEDGRYYVPANDADWMLRGAYRDRPAPEEEAAKLRRQAADELSRIRVKEPKELLDLSIHFAELDALLRAGQQRLAYPLVHEIDRVLSLWNCSDRLLDRRTALVGKLGRPDYEMANDNELGALYAARGAFDQSFAAYERAGWYAKALGDDRSHVKILSNTATLQWQRNDVRSAAERYDNALTASLSLHEPVLTMGALEGLADCHRRRGEYDVALRRAVEALAVAGSADFSDRRTAQEFASAHTVNVSLKMARWHCELGQPHEARKYIGQALAAEVVRHDDWLEASCHDGYADLALFEGDLPAAMTRATAAIERAGRLHDPITLLQARTTMCLAHLVAASPITAAAREIERAARYRLKGRSFIAVALQALVAQMEGRTQDAGRLFDQLLEEAKARTDRDERDFGAWDFVGFARCGRALDGGSLDRAIDAFRTARALTPPTPGLTARLHLLVTKLDAAGRHPGRLQPVIDLLEEAAGRTNGR